MSAAALCALDPVFAPLVARIPFALAPRAADPFVALARAIAGQQLHARAVAAILGRFTALYPGRDFPTPAQVLDTDAAALRGCGFSAAKIAALRGLSEQALTGLVPDRVAAETMSDAALIERLTVLRGVGRWTVEMLLIFTLGRPDVLPVDDWAVREGWRLLSGAESQLRPKVLAALGERWAPLRSTAAWYLWRAADEGKAR